MKVNADFRDLFAALNAAGAEYLLVGGYAFSFHAFPRISMFGYGLRQTTRHGSTRPSRSSAPPSTISAKRTWQAPG